MENLSRNDTSKQPSLVKKVGEGVYRSLQNCALADNRGILTKSIERCTVGSDRYNNMMCIRHILDSPFADLYEKYEKL